MVGKKTIAKLGFALEKRKKWFYVPILFMALFALRLVVTPFNDLWKNNFEAIAMLAIFIATVILAIGELNNDWEAHLPKRLTVIFTFQGLPVMKCEEAWLAGESDIRQWSQQIGKQMSDGEYLDFEPFVEQNEEVVERGEVFFKLFIATFQLTKVPKKFENTYQEGYPLWRWVKEENNKIELSVKHKQA
ncbi:MAG: hypothetical protein IPN76_11700 [Saprospiraceae bacterium]|nr:hypothetical protein [Saprospiraceae bacterium]